MKANVETLEPMVRPVAVTRPASTVRGAQRTFGFRPARAEATLFHAWHA